MRRNLKIIEKILGHFNYLTMRRAAIKGVGAYYPDDIITNEYLSELVDTNDDWITTRVGIKERRVLKEKGTSYMGVKAVKELLVKTNTNPDEIEVLIFATTTPDYVFPSTASITARECNIKNALGFDIQAACAGFIYALELGSNFIKAEKNKVIVVAGDKMTAITNYEDRTTCPLFGDAVGAVLLEPTLDDTGIIDSLLHVDGVGTSHLNMKGGGSIYPASHNTIENKMHYVYQEGRIVFKHAVSRMADVSTQIMKRNNLVNEDINWLVPHQANIRIIEAVGNRMGLEPEKVMVNIHKYGNTSAGTIPLCLYEWESKLKKGDNLILSAFGAGFTWGSIYLKWSY